MHRLPLRPLMLHLGFAIPDSTLQGRRYCPSILVPWQNNKESRYDEKAARFLAFVQTTQMMVEAARELYYPKFSDFVLPSGVGRQKGMERRTAEYWSYHRLGWRDDQYSPRLCHLHDRTRSAKLEENLYFQYGHLNKVTTKPQARGMNTV